MPSWEVNFDLHVDATRPSIVADLAQIHALAAVIRAIPIPPAVQARMPLEPVLSCSLDDLVEEPVATDVAPRQAGAVGRPDAKSGRVWGKLCHRQRSADAGNERETYDAR